MVKTKRTVMMLALGMLLVLFSTAFVAVPAQASMSRTASSPPTSSQPLQFGWSGWSEVSGNGFTVSGPATSFYLNEYAFVRGTNNRIYMNTLNGTTWIGWREVPGHGLTLSTPAAVSSVANLKLFVRGTDNKIYVNTLDLTTWSGWREVPGHGSTFDTPGAVIYSGTLKLFVRGTDNQLYVNTSTNGSNGTTWSGWSQVPGNGSTLSGPTAATLCGRRCRFTGPIGAGNQQSHLHEHLQWDNVERLERSVRP